MWTTFFAAARLWTTDRQCPSDPLHFASWCFPSALVQHAGVLRCSRCRPCCSRRLLSPVRRRSRGRRRRPCRCRPGRRQSRCRRSPAAPTTASTLDSVTDIVSGAWTFAHVKFGADGIPSPTGDLTAQPAGNRVCFQPGVPLRGVGRPGPARVRGVFPGRCAVADGGRTGWFAGPLDLRAWHRRRGVAGDRTRRRRRVRRAVSRPAGTCRASPGPPTGHPW